MTETNQTKMKTIVNLFDEGLHETDRFKPTVAAILFWYSHIYNTEGGGLVPEPFIGRIIGQAQKNLDEFSNEENKTRVAELEKILFNLIPGKEMLSVVTNSDGTVNIDTTDKESMLSSTLKDIAIQDRDSSNQLPRIWLVYNKGVLNWLLNNASPDNFKRFTDEVQNGTISPHFISKEEVNRLLKRQTDKGAKMPAIAEFIKGIESGRTYDDAVSRVNEMFDEKEITKRDIFKNESKPDRVTPKYPMRSIKLR